MHKLFHNLMMRFRRNSRKRSNNTFMFQLGTTTACATFMFFSLMGIEMNPHNSYLVIAYDSAAEYNSQFSSIVLDRDIPVEMLDSDIDVQPTSITYSDTTSEESVMVDSSETEVITNDDVSDVSVSEPEVESEIAETVEQTVEDVEQVNSDVEIDEVYPEETTPETEIQDGFVYYSELDLSEELQQYTWDIAQEYNVRHTLLLSIMYRESRFQTDATHWNSNGTMDSGLMQINDSCRSFLSNRGIVDLMDPYSNIEAGTILLRYYLDECDDNERMALMSYQYGLTGARNKYSQGITTSSALDLLYAIENDITTTGTCRR